MNGLWVYWWAVGRQSLRPFWNCINVSHGFSQSLTDVRLFTGACCSQTWCVYNFVDVCVCVDVHACVILIWVLSISHISVEAQRVPDNNIPLEHTGSVLM